MILCNESGYVSNLQKFRCDYLAKYKKRLKSCHYNVISYVTLLRTVNSYCEFHPYTMLLTISFGELRSEDIVYTYGE